MGQTDTCFATRRDEFSESTPQSSNGFAKLRGLGDEVIGQNEAWKSASGELDLLSREMLTQHHTIQIQI